MTQDDAADGPPEGGTAGLDPVTRVTRRSPDESAARLSRRAGLVVRAALRLMQVRVMLRTKPFSEARRRLVDERQSGSPAKAERVPQIVSAVDWAVRYSVPKAMCLPRSMCLASMLLDDGVPAQLCIGVRQAGGELQAHAWVESEGRVVGDRADIAAVYSRLGSRSELPAGTFVGAVRCQRPAEHIVS